MSHARTGGERKRVSVGHELLINPAVLMLDEPTRWGGWVGGWVGVGVMEAAAGELKGGLHGFCGCMGVCCLLACVRACG